MRRGSHNLKGEGQGRKQKEDEKERRVDLKDNIKKNKNVRDPNATPSKTENQKGSLKPSRA